MEKEPNLDNKVPNVGRAQVLKELRLEKKRRFEKMHPNLAQEATLETLHAKRRKMEIAADARVILAKAVKDKFGGKMECLEFVLRLSAGHFSENPLSRTPT